MPYQSLLLQFSKRGQRLFERFRVWGSQSTKAEIDHIENIKTQTAQIVVHCIHDFLS